MFSLLGSLPLGRRAPRAALESGQCAAIRTMQPADGTPADHRRSKYTVLVPSAQPVSQPGLSGRQQVGPQIPRGSQQPWVGPQPRVGLRLGLYAALLGDPQSTKCRSQVADTTGQVSPVDSPGNPVCSQSSSQPSSQPSRTWWSPPGHVHPHSALL